MRKGRSVCLVDVDNNRGLTRTLSVPEEAFRSTFDIFIGQANARDCLLPGEFSTVLNGQDSVVHLPERFAIIPASRSLESLDQILSKQPKIRPEKHFVRALGERSCACLSMLLSKLVLSWSGRKSRRPLPKRQIDSRKKKLAHLKTLLEYEEKKEITAM